MAEEGWYRHLVGRGQVVAGYPTAHRAAPRTKNYLLKMSAVPGLRNPAVFLWRREEAMMLSEGRKEDVRTVQIYTENGPETP